MARALILGAAVEREENSKRDRNIVRWLVLIKMLFNKQKIFAAEMLCSGIPGYRDRCRVDTETIA